DTIAADERPLQAIGMVHIVEPEPALDAKPVGVGWAIAAIDVEDLLVLDVDLGLAADAAVGAQRVDRARLVVDAPAGTIKQALLHQRAGWAHLHALTTGNAGRAAHAFVEVEHHLGTVAAVGHANDIIGLHLMAGAHAQAAVDARIEIDGDGGMRGVGRRAPILLGTAHRRHLHGVDPAPKLRPGIVGFLPPRPHWRTG